jgi:site-specific DNA-methyltransferase (cytosine-N4-specific)
VWWFSKTAWPKADNRRVLKPYSPDMIRLNGRGMKPTVRPSGHVIIKDSWGKLGEGAIPGNVVEADGLDAPIPDAMLKFGNNASNDEYAERSKELGLKRHPARFPAALPEFFIKLLTEESDLVIDPFAGSNTTGAVAERLCRKWIAMEQKLEYVEASRVRFEGKLAGALGRGIRLRRRSQTVRVMPAR